MQSYGSFGRHVSLNHPLIQEMLKAKRDDLGLVIFEGSHYDYETSITAKAHRPKEPIESVELKECLVQSYWHRFHCEIQGMAQGPDGQEVAVGFDSCNACWYPVVERAVNHEC